MERPASPFKSVGNRSGGPEGSRGTNPDDEAAITRRTLRWELVRAVAMGVLETAFLTFALLIAIESYEAGITSKSLILGSHAFGLITSLFLIPLLAQMRLTTTLTAAIISGSGAVGFALAALAGGRLSLYLTGICTGFFCMALQIPLQTQWLRSNYPDARRGRWFGAVTVLRATTSVCFGLGAGIWLEEDFSRSSGLLWVFALALTLAGFAAWRIPGEVLPRGRRGVFAAMRWVRQDSRFRVLLASAMLMGMGVLMSMALRVDYLVREEFGLQFDPARVALLTATLPALMRLTTTFFWGMLFDRVHFLRLRTTLNALLGVSLVLFFWTDRFWIIALGSLLGGVARGGGEILWNLWVTKLARREHAAEYMSVHTFFTGLRGAVAPFLGFWLAAVLSLRGMVTLSVSLVTLSILIVLPLMKTWERSEP